MRTCEISCFHRFRSVSQQSVQSCFGIFCQVSGILVKCSILKGRVTAEFTSDICKRTRNNETLSYAKGANPTICFIYLTGSISV